MSKFFSVSFSLRSALFLVIVLLSHTSRAVSINFDDIVRVPTEGCFCDHPITNEYAAQGLLVSDGYLVDQDSQIADGISPPNALLGGPTFQLRFIGKLPTLVEFYVSAPYDQASFITVNGPKGFLFTRQTAGYAGSDDDPAYIPNQLVSLKSAGGISSLDITAFFDLRVSCQIDNLHYEYANLPEPSLGALMLMGLGMLLVRRRGGAGEIF